MFKPVKVDEFANGGVWFAVRDHFTGLILGMASSVEQANKLKQCDKDRILPVDITKKLLGGLNVEIGGYGI